MGTMLKFQLDPFWRIEKYDGFCCFVYDCYISHEICLAWKRQRWLYWMQSKWNEIYTHQSGIVSQLTTYLFWFSFAWFYFHSISLSLFLISLTNQLKVYSCDSVIYWLMEPNYEPINWRICMRVFLFLRFRPDFRQNETQMNNQSQIHKKKKVFIIVFWYVRYFFFCLKSTVFVRLKQKRADANVRSNQLEQTVWFDWAPERASKTDHAK